MRPVDLRLYLLVDPGQASGGRAALPAIAEAAARGGATLVQYRDKLAETAAFVETARAIVAVLRRHRVPLLINDRADVALAASADGVHLGRSDMSASDARRILGPRALVGLTIKSEHDARDCPDHLVDYGCIGGVFETGSKDNPDPAIGLSGLAARVRTFRARGSTMPLGAIAGINGGNVGSVIAAGVDGVAIMSAITRAADPEAASRALRAIVDGALAPRVGAPRVGAPSPALAEAS